LSFWSDYLKNIEKWLKNNKKIPKKTRQDFEKNAFFQPAKLSRCLPFFCRLMEKVSFLVISAPFSQNIEN